MVNTCGMGFLMGKWKVRKKKKSKAWLNMWDMVKWSKLHLWSSWKWSSRKWMCKWSMWTMCKVKKITSNGKDKVKGKVESQSKLQKWWCRQGGFKASKLHMMGWGKHFMSLHLLRSLHTCFYWTTFLHPMTCTRSSYKWIPSLTKASMS